MLTTKPLPSALVCGISKRIEDPVDICDRLMLSGRNSAEHAPSTELPKKLGTDILFRTD